MAHLVYWYLAKRPQEATQSCWRLNVLGGNHTETNLEMTALSADKSYTFEEQLEAMLSNASAWFAPEELRAYREQANGLRLLAQCMGLSIHSKWELN